MHVSTTSISCLESRITYGKTWHTHLRKLAPPTLLANLIMTNFYQRSRPFLAIKAQLKVPSINHFNNLENLEESWLINMMRHLNNDRTTPTRLDRWLDYHHFGWDRDNKTQFEAGVAIAKIMETGNVELEVLTAKRTVRRPAGLAGFTELPANKELIMPNCTVDRHYLNKGVKLIRPDLPCMLFGNPLERENRHGFRGSSAKSLRRNRGKACWRQGERNYELIPPERIYWANLEQALRDNEQHSEHVSAQPEHDTWNDWTFDGKHPTPQQDANRTSTPVQNERGTREFPTIPTSPVIICKKSGNNVEPFDNGGFNQSDSTVPIEPMAGITLGNTRNTNRNVRRNVQSNTQQSTRNSQLTIRSGTSNRPQSTTQGNRPQSITHPRSTINNNRPRSIIHNNRPRSTTHQQVPTNKNTSNVPAHLSTRCTQTQHVPTHSSIHRAQTQPWPHTLSFSARHAPPTQHITKTKERPSQMCPSISILIGIVLSLFCCNVACATPIMLFDIELWAPPHTNRALNVQIILNFDISKMAQAQIEKLSSSERKQLKLELMPIPSLCIVCDSKGSNPIGHRPGDSMCPFYNDGYKRKTWREKLGLPDKLAARRAKAALIKKLGKERLCPTTTARLATTTTLKITTNNESKQQPIITASAIVKTTPATVQTTEEVSTVSFSPPRSPSPACAPQFARRKITDDFLLPPFVEANQQVPTTILSTTKKLKKKTTLFVAPTITEKAAPKKMMEEMVSKFTATTQQKTARAKSVAFYEKELCSLPIARPLANDYCSVLDPDSLQYAGKTLTKEKLNEMELQRPLTLKNWRTMMQQRVGKMLDYLLFLDGSKHVQNVSQSSHLAHPRTWQLVKEIYEQQKKEKNTKSNKLIKKLPNDDKKIAPHRAWTTREVESFLIRCDNFLQQPIKAIVIDDQLLSKSARRLLTSNKRRNSLSPTSAALLDGYEMSMKNVRRFEGLLSLRPSFARATMEEEEENLKKESTK